LSTPRSMLPGGRRSSTSLRGIEAGIHQVGQCQTALRGASWGQVLRGLELKARLGEEKIVCHSPRQRHSSARVPPVIVLRSTEEWAVASRSGGIPGED
jgi:hypothetical protein